jgi:hypothetical protein
MQPYRDPTHGIEARLADLRARWADAAAAIPAGVRSVVHERGRRMHSARAVVAMQSALTILLVWLVYRHGQEPACRCGMDFPSAMTAVALTPVIVVAIAVARAAGRLYGAGRARRALARALGGPHTLEMLANRTPLAVACDLAAALERPSSGWATASRGAVLALLVLAAAAGVHAGFYETYLTAVAMVAVQAAMVLNRGLCVPVVATAAVALAAGAGVDTGAVVLLLVHIAYVSVRAWLLGRAVAKERAALAHGAAGCASTGR